jgi:hypothetical protein
MSPEQITVDKRRMTEVITAILNPPVNQEILIPTEIEPPEKKFIDLINQYPPPFPLNALFLTTTMVFADNTRSLFKKITHKDLLNHYAWIFMPDKIIEAANQGTNIVDACRKFFRPGGYNGNALDQWLHNCQVLQNIYDGDIKKFFKENNGDAVRTVNALVVRPRAKTSEKPEFRRFGPKIASLFVQWVGFYDLYQLQNINQISIPIDFQIARIAIQCRAIDFQTPITADLITRRRLSPLITDICQENNFIPANVSEAMWEVGNQRCNKRQHRGCPVENLCTRIISRIPYDKGGKFDPTDIGRYS